MNELDARLRAMAKRENLSLPTEYETAMDHLEEKARQVPGDPAELPSGGDHVV